MSKILMALLRMTQFGIVGDDGGGEGGQKVDRGDEIVTETDDAAAAEAAAKAAETDDEAAAVVEGMGETAQGDEDDDEDDDKSDDDEDDAAKGAARGKDGKFVSKKEVTIPKARFDELRRQAREREQALLDKVDALTKAAKQDAEKMDAKGLEKEVEELEVALQKQLDDGETAKARETMRAIRLKERQIIEAQVEHKSERARALAIEQFKVDTLVERLEGEFPQINPDSDDYDEDVVAEIALMRTGFERTGMASSAAIAKAVKYVLGTATKKEAEVDVDETEGGKKGLRDTKTNARKQEQVKKNVDAATKQPPKLDKAGVDSNKKGGGAESKTISEMSDEELAALPASTRARLRGDLIDETAT
jgi:hypothetical protein